jgi:hypothetical protein
MDWNHYEQNIERERTARELAESRYEQNIQRELEVSRFSANTSIESPVLDNELVIKKHGLLGKLKLAFNYGDKRLPKNSSNVDSIFVKYRDVARRKFVWKIWEKESGNYESYKDFKDSWDPNISIFQKIKETLKKDVQTEIEGILGITRNKGLQYSTRKGLGISNIKAKADNLVQNKKPFSNPIVSNGEETNLDSNNKPSNSHKHSHHKHSSHKHTCHKHSSHSHGNSHSHSHSHSHTHSHNRSHTHSHRHNHRSHRNHTRQRSYSRERYI